MPFAAKSLHLASQSEAFYGPVYKQVGSLSRGLKIARLYKRIVSGWVTLLPGTELRPVSFNLVFQKHSWRAHVSPSSETQGQLHVVGPGKSLNGREKNSGKENCSHRFRLSPAPLTAPGSPRMMCPQCFPVSHTGNIWPII